MFSDYVRRVGKIHRKVIDFHKNEKQINSTGLPVCVTGKDNYFTLIL